MSAIVTPTHKSQVHVQEEMSHDHQVRIAKNRSSFREPSHLMKLVPKQMSTLAIPNECSVWFKHNGQMASGIVKSIYLDLSNKEFHYKIKNFKDNSQDLIPYNDLCLGAGCPVSVEMLSTSSSKPEELDGEVLCARVDSATVYTVMLYIDQDKKHFKIEENVAQERIKCRQAVVIENESGNKRPRTSDEDNRTSSSKMEAKRQKISPKAQKICKAPFYIHVPKMFLRKDDDSRQKLSDHLRNDVSLKALGFLINVGGNKEKMHLSAYTHETQHNTDIVNEALRKSLIAFESNNC
mmetsp:Transcript_42851/g.73108  ORF Transcript_42851/g.73108 Transcript_42851/m.73108 type:complete len:294 (+) Transcript_42851:268-1149(+)|eukprot:CAMPEP_0183760878 /NCGR_PEP_ID=MMETSP0739-20130205/8045_1 /TAXON_ID=385413 /ORGANISM="Thalassiosira miniscula, Strain CCMP1093" /LENGTH=293 /DNA_ID=CAMNT_0025998919 /DNA_START=170 /DNA_END=1051 /DNA_ORIENTATION=-